MPVRELYKDIITKLFSNMYFGEKKKWSQLQYKVPQQCGMGAYMCPENAVIMYSNIVLVLLKILGDLIGSR